MKPVNSVHRSSDSRQFTISVKAQPYLYLRVKLTIERENVGELSTVQYKFLIMQAVKETLGQVGASLTIDLLKLSDGGEALLRVPSRNAEKVWAALTLYGTTPSQKRCAFCVLQTSPYLMGLAFNSRDMRWQ